MTLDTEPASEMESTVGVDASLEMSDETELSALQFLKIHLTQDQPYLLPVEALVELLKVPIDQVMPMFCMAPWVAGVYNLRGEVLWVADLNHFLGLPPWYSQVATASQHTLVVVQACETHSTGDYTPKLGLIVNHIAGMTGYLESDVQTDLSKLDLTSSTFVCGVIKSSRGLEQILDIHTIMASMAETQT